MVNRVTTLSVVADGRHVPALSQREGISDRVRRLQAEARALAHEHIGALDEAILRVEQLAAEIASGGEAYPAGVRDIARRLSEDCDAKLMNIRAIAGR